MGPKGFLESGNPRHWRRDAAHGAEGLPGGVPQGPLRQSPLDGPIRSVSEVMVNGADDVYVELNVAPRPRTARFRASSGRR
jgi:hypothetical protein